MNEKLHVCCVEIIGFSKTHFVLDPQIPRMPGCGVHSTPILSTSPPPLRRMDCAHQCGSAAFNARGALEICLIVCHWAIKGNDSVILRGLRSECFGRKRYRLLLPDSSLLFGIDNFFSQCNSLSLVLQIGIQINSTVVLVNGLTCTWGLKVSNPHGS